MDVSRNSWKYIARICMSTDIFGKELRNVHFCPIYFEDYYHLFNVYF